MSRIGELLVREKMLSLQQLQQAQEEAKRSGLIASLIDKHSVRGLSVAGPAD